MPGKGRAQPRPAAGAGDPVASFWRGGGASWGHSGGDGDAASRAHAGTRVCTHTHTHVCPYPCPAAQRRLCGGCPAPGTGGWRWHGLCAGSLPVSCLRAACPAASTAALGAPGTRHLPWWPWLQLEGPGRCGACAAGCARARTCMHTHVDIYMHAGTHVHAHGCMHTLAHVHAHTQACTYVGAHLHIHAGADVHMHAHMCVHTHVHTRMYTHTDMHTHTRAHTHACTHTHAHMRVHGHTHIHLHMCTHAYAQTHARIRPCMHTHAHTHTHLHACSWPRREAQHGLDAARFPVFPVQPIKICWTKQGLPAGASRR